MQASDRLQRNPQEIDLRQSRPQRMRDIVGIGALNLDLIATRQRSLSVEPQLLHELLNRFEQGTEETITESQVKLLLSQFGASIFEKYLGGSAFNVIHTIAWVNPHFRLGYVGVAGQTNIPDLDFVSALKRLRVDTQFLKIDSEAISGICISYMNEGERSLLTCPGANNHTAAYLSEHYDSVLDYLSQTKLIHLTSFFDSATPQVLLQLLEAAKRKNPWLELSFDPGHQWLLRPTSEVLRLLRLSDYLFLNQREFENLGHSHPGSDGLTTAEDIFRACAPSSPLLVLKRPDEIKLFYKIKERLVCRRYTNNLLPIEVIEDATGAGDVFAGGFLTARLLPWMELSDGVELGLSLVKSKLLAGGSQNFCQFPAILNEIIYGLSKKE